MQTWLRLHDLARRNNSGGRRSLIRHAEVLRCPSTALSHPFSGPGRPVIDPELPARTEDHRLDASGGPLLSRPCQCATGPDVVFARFDRVRRRLLTRHVPPAVVGGHDPAWRSTTTTPFVTREGANCRREKLLCILCGAFEGGQGAHASWITPRMSVAPPPGVRIGCRPSGHACGPDARSHVGVPATCRDRAAHVGCLGTISRPYS